MWSISTKIISYCYIQNVKILSLVKESHQYYYYFFILYHDKLFMLTNLTVLSFGAFALTR